MRRATRKTDGKRQTRLSFTPLATSSSPGPERSPGSGTDSLAKVRYQDPFSSPLALKSKSTPRAFSKSPESAKGESATSDEEAIRGPKSHRRMVKRAISEDEDNGSESEDIVAYTPAKRRR